MPLKPKHKRVTVPLTEAQYEHLKSEAEKSGMGLADFIRTTLIAHTDLPDDMPKRGAYIRNDSN